MEPITIGLLAVGAYMLWKKSQTPKLTYAQMAQLYSKAQSGTATQSEMKKLQDAIAQAKKAAQSQPKSSPMGGASSGGGKAAPSSGSSLWDALFGRGGAADAIDLRGNQTSDFITEWKNAINTPIEAAPDISFGNGQPDNDFLSNLLGSSPTAPEPDYGGPPPDIAFDQNLDFGFMEGSPEPSMPNFDPYSEGAPDISFNQELNFDFMNSAPEPSEPSYDGGTDYSFLAYYV